MGPTALSIDSVYRSSGGQAYNADGSPAAPAVAARAVDDHPPSECDVLLCGVNK